MGAKAPETKYPESQILAVEENSLVGIVPVSALEKKPLLACSVASNDDLWEGLEYKTLIKCLARYESSYNPLAIGDKGAAIGLLQFHRPTWERYCESRGFNNIQDPRQQVQCCDAMLKENFKNIGHWSTAGLCLWRCGSH